ncbi:MAG: DUF4091 domain-containing protein [Calditrichaeota bacterium]|nr:MAG: DUF4091 domain-containing protein [Calditrichota bacterium]
MKFLRLIFVIFTSLNTVIAQNKLKQPSSQNYGNLIEKNSNLEIWWANSGWKIGKDWKAPKEQDKNIFVSSAKNESESFQIIVNPKNEIENLTIQVSDLKNENQKILSSKNFEFKIAKFLDLEFPSDSVGFVGSCPDPLPEIQNPLSLPKNSNSILWVTFKIPKNTTSGKYFGTLSLNSKSFSQKINLQIKVYDFEIPDKMTCKTAFGFYPSFIKDYHKLENENQEREVFDKYFELFSKNHISPYDFTPLDPIKVEFPSIKPFSDLWSNSIYVENEKHSGKFSFMIFDDEKSKDIYAEYKNRIKIEFNKIKISFWHKTFLPEHSFLFALSFFDKNGKWIRGKNLDILVTGSGFWENFEKEIDNFPKGAKSFKVVLRATTWTPKGEKTGLVYFDDISIKNFETNEELLENNSFEKDFYLPKFEPSDLEVKVDFVNWNREIRRGIEKYNFTSFRFWVEGLGRGNFQWQVEPQINGFTPETKHYQFMFDSYLKQLEANLEKNGWLDEAFIYSFDEPTPSNYNFVKNGFGRLENSAPKIQRLLTEQVENELIGSVDIWCPLINEFDFDEAEERKKAGEKFWWYICTIPKNDYVGLFIDRPATDLRVWLWQTYQMNVEGILIWQTNYWSIYNKKYPLQNPYVDPMSWFVTGENEKGPWGNGDGRFIYPPESVFSNSDSPNFEKPVSSIRLEVLRDGIEDYEYLVILEKLVSENFSRLSKEKLNYYKNLLEVPDSISKGLTEFTKTPEPILKRRDEIAKAIEELRIKN